MAGSALTPELALDYLGELSTDIQAGVLLDGAGRLAAASAAEEGRRDRLRDLVTELMTRADEAAGGGGAAHQLEVATADGVVFLVRAGGWTLAVAARRQALPSLMFYDLRSVLSDLGPAPGAGDAR